MNISDDLKESIRQACATLDARAAGAIVDRLRFRLAYSQVCALFVQHGHIDADDFEELMMRADEADAMSELAA